MHRGQQSFNFKIKLSDVQETKTIFTWKYPVVNFPDYGTVNPNTIHKITMSCCFKLCLVIDCKQLRSNLSITCNIHNIWSKGQLCQIQYLLYHYQSFSLPRSGQRGWHKCYIHWQWLLYFTVSPEIYDSYSICIAKET